MVDIRGGEQIRHEKGMNTLRYVYQIESYQLQKKAQSGVKITPSKTPQWPASP
jgi:hypothetical protein